MRRFLSALLLLAMAFTSSVPAEPLLRLDLSGAWSFHQAGKEAWLPATVPGCVHNDLLVAGKIPDPFFRNNADSVQWIEREDWEYSRTFSVSADLLRRDVVELVFDGLDTYADVYINDSLVIRADNMFTDWRASVRPLLREGENSLRVYFHSPVIEGLRKKSQLPYILKMTNEIAPEDQRTNVFTRKAPFHYGWDWGPRLVTSGIWKPVYLQGWDKARIEDAFLEPLSVNPDTARYQARTEITVTQPGRYEVEVRISGLETTFKNTLSLEVGLQTILVPFELVQPKLWWSHGLGEAHLYPVEVSLKNEDAQLGKVRRQLGVRTLELVQEPDSFGRSFYFRLNGVPVFAKGANYIPSHIFTQLQTPAIYERLIGDALAANMNMLRVWGGAVYEDDYFYDLCDQNGILVWQDFMFACALNPADSLHLENIRKEADFQVRRLRHHASLALWCGNNENLIAWHRWGWKTAYSPEVSNQMWADYERIFYTILPTAVGAYNPQISYWPSSPQAFGNELPDRKTGDEHDWTVWFNEKSYADYGVNTGRFVSEWGLQSFPEMATIDSFATQNDYSYRSEAMEYRQRSFMPWIGKNVNGNEMIRRYVDRYYGDPANFADFVYLSQLNQALAYKTGAEAHRTAMPKCMGSLYWQINDCWPSLSWSSIDYYGRWKASHYAIQHAFAPLIVVPGVTDDQVWVDIVSDKLQPVAGQLTLRILDFKGDTLWQYAAPATAQANGKTRIVAGEVPQRWKGKKLRHLVLVADWKGTDGVSAHNLYYPEWPKDQKLPETEVRSVVAPAGKGYQVTLTSNQLAVGVYLNFPGVDGHFSDNYFDLLPGETRVVTFAPQQTGVTLPKLEVVYYQMAQSRK